MARQHGFRMANEMEENVRAQPGLIPMLPRAGIGWRERTVARTVCYLAFVGLISSHFALAYITGTKPYMNLRDYVNGTATLPFQYRALTSWILSFASDTPLMRTVSSGLPAPFNDPVQLSLLLVVAIAFACFIEIARRSIILVTQDRDLSAICAVLAPATAYVTYVAMANTYRWSYPYDIPSLALFSLAYFFLLKADLLAFFVAFFVASLSRETSLFLILIFICHRWTGIPSFVRRDGINVTLLAAIFVAVRIALFVTYGNNLRETAIGHEPSMVSVIPGALFVFQPENLENLVSPQYWPSMLSVVGWLWLAVLFRWRFLNRSDIRRTLLVVSPVWFLAMLVGGRLTEVRLFGELTLVFVVAVAIILKNWLVERGYRSHIG